MIDIFLILIYKEIKEMDLSKNDFVRVIRNKFRLIDEDDWNKILLILMIIKIILLEIVIYVYA